MKFESTNPHSPSEIVEEFEAVGPEGVEEAVRRARKACPEWKGQPAATRGLALTGIADSLEGRAEDVARLVVREVGKPIAEARVEVGRAVAILRYYAQLVLAPDGETYPSATGEDWLLVRRSPLGTCALITPWNFPVAIPVWKAAPALVYGNTVVLKPAPHSTATARVLGRIFDDHLPEGAFEMVPGGAETGAPLVEHPDVSAISFTGSLGAGRSVARQAVERGARVQCEMGGQNPSVVLADADLDLAATTIAYAAMGYAGQKCTATGRIIVEASVYDEVRDRLVAAIEDMKVVGPEDESCQVGPLISVESRTSALDALRSGGKVLSGGESLDEEGFYLSPALVEVEDPRSRLAQEEIFAPVAALMQASTAEEALSLANNVQQGLAAAVFTRDLGRAASFAEGLEAGLVRVNAATSGVDYHVPFGGLKDSGIGGREQGLAARGFYTNQRTILISPNRM